MLILASFAIAMLAAFGLQLLLNGTAAERRRMLIAAAVVAVLPALVVVGAHPQWLGVLPDGVKRVFGAGAETVDAVALASVLRWLAFAAAAIAVFAALARWRHRTALLIAAAIGLAALDLLTVTAGYNPAISQAEASPPQPPAVAALRRVTAGGGRVVGVQAMQPNTASRWGLDDARGHEQPSVGRVALLWRVLGGGVELQRARREPGGPARPEAARRVRRAGGPAPALGRSRAPRCATRRSSTRARAASWSPTPARCRRRSSPTAGARARAATRRRS